MAVDLRRPVREHLDNRFRRLVHYQSEILRYDPARISAEIDLPLRTVQYILQRRDVVTQLVKEPWREGRARVLGSEERQVSRLADTAVLEVLNYCFLACASSFVTDSSTRPTSS